MNKNGGPNMVKGGPSLNPLGRGRHKPLSDALKMELAANPKQARRIVRRLLQDAEAGDKEAVKIILDRTEGKPLQMLEMGGPGDFMELTERHSRILELQRKVLVEDAVEIPLLPTATGVKK